jgi:hypothetical protein
MFCALQVPFAVEMHNNYVLGNSNASLFATDTPRGPFGDTAPLQPEANGLNQPRSPTSAARAAWPPA